MSTTSHAADAVLQPARTQHIDSPAGQQGEQGVAVPAQGLQPRPTGTRDDEPFGHIWQLFGYAILDDAGTKMGSVARVWTDLANGRLKFVGLTTGRLRRRTCVIPAQDARIDDHSRSMKMPYRAATIRGAPHHNTDVTLSNDQERKVYTHYDNS